MEEYFSLVIKLTVLTHESHAVFACIVCRKSLTTSRERISGFVPLTEEEVICLKHQGMKIKRSQNFFSVPPEFRRAAFFL